MRRIKLTVSYFGGDFCGWQIQPNGVSVQAVLTEAVYQITGERVVIHGAGRTDAGVHALAQVAHFDTMSRVPAEKFAPALNTKLPLSVRVVRSEAVESDFHSQFSACGKSYCYRLYCDPVESPFYGPYTWHVRGDLDLGTLREAAACFVGTHDFRGFMASRSDVVSTVRRIYDISVVDCDPIIEIHFSGNGFLYNMVRIIVGTIVETATGKIPLSDLPMIIASGERALGGRTAPACGLMLMQVTY